MKETKISSAVLAPFPSGRKQAVDQTLAREAAANQRKIVVLDDDPTGVQTVHDINVYTDWSVESIRQGFAETNRLFFILTNSRGFTEAETTKAHKEIAANIDQVSKETGIDYLVISRSDSAKGVSCPPNAALRPSPSAPAPFSTQHSPVPKSPFPKSP